MADFDDNAYMSCNYGGNDDDVPKPDSTSTISRLIVVVRITMVIKPVLVMMAVVIARMIMICLLRTMAVAM